MPIGQRYAESLHINFPPYFANFPPINPVSIGDFGTLYGDLFMPISNLKTAFRINPFDEIKDQSPQAEFEFSHGKSVVIDAKAKGTLGPDGVPLPNAALSIKFGADLSIFFNARDCQIVRMADPTWIANEILRLYALDLWMPSYVLVTSLMRVKKLLVVISNGKEASIDIAADAAVPVDNWKLATDLKFGRESNIATKWNVNANSVPFVGLSRVERKTLFGQRGKIRTIAHALPSNRPTEDPYAIKQNLRDQGKKIEEEFALLELR